MDKTQLIKYAALALGAYMVYRFWIQPALTDAVPVKVLPGQPPPQPVVNSTPPPAPPPPAQAVTTPGMATEADFIRWATDQSAANSADRSKTLTFDEWNYYRSKGGKTVMDALAAKGITPDNRGTIKFNAAEYWYLMQSSGMSGLPHYMYEGEQTNYGGLGLVHPNYAWLT